MEFVQVFSRLNFLLFSVFCIVAFSFRTATGNEWNTLQITLSLCRFSMHLRVAAFARRLSHRWIGADGVAATFSSPIIKTFLYDPNPSNHFRVLL